MWGLDDCTLRLVLNGESFVSTLAWIFELAIRVGLECSQSHPPQGGYFILHSQTEMSAYLYARGPERAYQSDKGNVPSSANNISILNGIDSWVLDTFCLIGFPAPSLSDCNVLFVDEMFNPDSGTLYMFGPKGNYPGPYSWVAGDCEIRLDMMDIPSLTTNKPFIFTTALSVQTECALRRPARSGFARLGGPYLGVEIEALHHHHQSPQAFRLSKERDSPRSHRQ